MPAALCLLTAPPSRGDIPSARAEAATRPSEVQSRRIIPLPGEGRRIILERVKPPVLPTDPPRSLITPEAAARRDARRSRVEQHRFLPLTIARYADGWNLLKWSDPDPKGLDDSPQQFSAWSRTDFRFLWWMDELVVDGLIYSVMPIGLGPLLREAPGKPGPLTIGRSAPEFHLVSGDPANAAALRPIEALHEHYYRVGAQLEADHQKLQTETTAAADRLKANPPVPADSVIRFWPIRSKRFPVPPAAIQPALPAKPTIPAGTSK